MKIWALEEYYKINPKNGNILEYHKNNYDKPQNHSLRRKNSIWSADKKLINLCAAKNETVGMQLIIELEKEKRVSNLDVSVSGLKGPSIIKSEACIKLYKEWFVPVQKQWYADPLIPLDQCGAAEIPDRKNKIPGQKLTAFYIEIFIPAESPAGGYSGTVAVKAGKTILAEMQLNLKVLDIKLPQSPGFTFELNNYGVVSSGRPKKMLSFDQKHAHINSAEFDRELLNYHLIAREHYASLNVLPYSQKGLFAQSMAPSISKEGKVKSWKAYTRRFDRFLTGKAFKSGYGAGIPAAIHYLPFSAAWPAPFELYGTKEYGQIIANTARAFQAYIKKRNWTRTDFQIVLNHKERYGHFPFNGDEPTREKDFKALGYYGKILKDALGRKSAAKISYRLDIGHYECRHLMDKCDRLPGEKLCRHKKQLDGIVDLWVIGYRHAKPESVLKRLKRGENAWAYFGSSWINRPHWDMRQFLLQSYSRNVAGYCAWTCNGWEKDKNPFFDSGRSNGFNYLLYPGSDMGIPRPLPSLRLKMVRSAVIDCAYLDMLKKSRAGQDLAKKLLKKILRGFDGFVFSSMDVASVDNSKKIPINRVDWAGIRKQIAEKILK
ncbi:MAG: glycoside hydrolase domain-containing protein [bacterium]